MNPDRFDMVHQNDGWFFDDSYELESESEANDQLDEDDEVLQMLIDFADIVLRESVMGGGFIIKDMADYFMKTGKALPNGYYED